MGTNFYFGKNRDIHIGKRSAAGWYCWDCGETLCSKGTSHVHHGRDEDWLDRCPRCRQRPEPESISEGAAGRELGFNKDNSQRKTGVKSCCSFSWAITLKQLWENRRKQIYDEYGAKFSFAEFMGVLEECPIQSFGSVGVEFS